jgi:hypothetical protein
MTEKLRFLMTANKDASVAIDAAKYRDKAASQLNAAALSFEQERARQWFEDHAPKTQ